MGLKIKPCMPKEINEFNLTRKFRGATYEIFAVRDEKKAAGVYINGIKQTNDLLPQGKTGETIKAEVIYK